MARIAIDIRKVGDYGIGRYIERLVYHLSRLDTGTHTFHLLGDDRAKSRFPSNLMEDRRFRWIRVLAPSYSIREQFSLPLALYRSGIELYHSTHYVLPQAPLPKLVVTTVHDLIHLIFPEMLPSKLAHFYARHFLGRAVRRSTALITGSRTSRSDLCRIFPSANRKRIRIIPYGVGKDFTPRSGHHDLAEESRSLEALDIDRPFFLYVGNFKPHKNLSIVIEAFNYFLEQSGETHLLVLVGRELTQEHGLDTSLKSLKRPELVRAPGYLDDSELPILYRNALAFLFPSLYEGFGLPPLEAMASGTPVVASDRAALPEVLGSAAELVDAGDARGLARVMFGLSTDPARRESMRRDGLDHAAGYTWARTARLTLDLYESLLRSSSVSN